MIIIMKQFNGLLFGEVVLLFWIRIVLPGARRRYQALYVDLPEHVCTVTKMVSSVRREVATARTGTRRSCGASDARLNGGALRSAARS